MPRRGFNPAPHRACPSRHRTGRAAMQAGRKTAAGPLSGGTSGRAIARPARRLPADRLGGKGAAAGLSRTFVRRYHTMPPKNRAAKEPCRAKARHHMPCRRSAAPCRASLPQRPHDPSSKSANAPRRQTPMPARPLDPAFRAAARPAPALFTVCRQSGRCDFAVPRASLPCSFHELPRVFPGSTLQVRPFPSR